VCAHVCAHVYMCACVNRSPKVKTLARLHSTVLVPVFVSVNVCAREPYPRSNYDHMHEGLCMVVKVCICMRVDSCTAHLHLGTCLGVCVRVCVCGGVMCVCVCVCLCGVRVCVCV